MRRTCPPTVPDDAFYPETAVEPTVLDQGVVSRGLVARRRAIELLDGIGDQLDAVEARADVLLAELLELLEEQGSEPERLRLRSQAAAAPAP
jgi:hypothetical protein